MAPKMCGQMVRPTSRLSGRVQAQPNPLQNTRRKEALKKWRNLLNGQGLRNFKYTA